MTIYERPRAEVFADSAPPSEIQPFPAWLRGLGIAFDETNGYPEMTGLNGLFNAFNVYIKYLEQNGLAEWRADLEYPVGAGVRSGFAWYKARTRNTNKVPSTSQSDWVLLVNVSDLNFVDPIYFDTSTNQLSVKQASTTQVGVSRFANITEIANKQNASVAINPMNASTIAQSTDLGVAQIWRNVSSQRFSNNNYRNISSKPIAVSISIQDPNSTAALTVTVGGVVIIDVFDFGATGTHPIFFIVPPDTVYNVNTTQNLIRNWSELS